MSVDNQWRSRWREHYIYKWFNTRLLNAQEEYLNCTNDPAMVYYRGMMFSPTKLKCPRGILREVEPNTDIADVLDRQLRVREQIQEATGHLTYVLNYCDDLTDFKYLFGLIEGVEHTRLDDFKRDNESRFQAFKRYELLADLI